MSVLIHGFQVALCIGSLVWQNSAIRPEVGEIWLPMGYSLIKNKRNILQTPTCLLPV